MNEQQYIEQRLDEQIQWYNQKSTWNQRMYKYLRVAEISCAAFIPFLVGFISEDSAFSLNLKILVGALGSLIAILTGIQSVFRLQENWVQYRVTSEALRREKIFFQAKVGIYTGEDAFIRLVQQAENIMAAEQGGWIQYTTSKENKTPTS
jgi:Protein of unknown function (DUF4231)